MWLAVITEEARVVQLLSLVVQFIPNYAFHHCRSQRYYIDKRRGRVLRRLIVRYGQQGMAGSAVYTGMNCIFHRAWSAA